MLIEAGGLRRLGHGDRVGMVGRQRLFAKHVLAGRDQRQCGRHMDAVGRAVDGGVEVAPGDRLRRARRKAPAMPLLGGEGSARPGTRSTQATMSAFGDGGEFG